MNSGRCCDDSTLKANSYRFLYVRNRGVKCELEHLSSRFSARYEQRKCQYVTSYISSVRIGATCFGVHIVVLQSRREATSASSHGNSAHGMLLPYST